MRAIRCRRATGPVFLAVLLALILVMAWGATAPAAPGQFADGALTYICPYAAGPVSAEFHVTQLTDRNKGSGWATFTTSAGTFTVDVKLARVDGDTAYFAGPTSQSQLSNWWYFAGAGRQCGRHGRGLRALRLRLGLRTQGTVGRWRLPRHAPGGGVPGSGDRVRHDLGLIGLDPSVGARGHARPT